MPKQTLIYYGNGEGKTSAAIGHAIRASAYGKVAIVFFMKGRETGEVKALKKIKNIKVFLAGPREFLTEKTDMLHFVKAREALKLTKKLTQSSYNLVVLDEILYALHFKLVTESEIIDLIKKSKSSLILTGSRAAKKILEQATIATEFRKIRHHYEKDKKTIKGIDY